MTGAAMERALRKAREVARESVAPSSSAPVARERGVLFSPPMVRAILAGLKSQTRRLVNPQPREAIDVGAAVAAFIDRRPHFDSVAGRVVGTRDVTILCPLGSPGDRLWVREAWRAPHWLNDRPPRDVPAGTPIAYLADEAKAGDPAGKYRHARFMPRRFSRITLEVTEVRVQRLQAISDQDAIAEGVTATEDPPTWKVLNKDGSAYDCYVEPDRRPGDGIHAYVKNAPLACLNRTAVENYSRLWDDINGPGAWALNPWVWAVSFRRAA